MGTLFLYAQYVNVMLESTLMARSPYFAAIYKEVAYFFGYKTDFFPFQNNSKDLDPSCKTDLNLWDCLGRVKLVLLQNFIGLIKLLEVILEGKTLSYIRINTVQLL